MLHVLFSISAFIQVSNNEARKCDLNLYNYIYITSVLLLRYASKVGPGLSAQTKERAVFGWKTRTRSSLDDVLSIVYTEAEIRRPRPFIPSKLPDVLEAWFVPIISVKTLLHILVKSRKINLPIEEKNLVFLFHEILGSFNQC